MKDNSTAASTATLIASLAPSVLAFIDTTCFHFFTRDLLDVREDHVQILVGRIFILNRDKLLESDSQFQHVNRSIEVHLPCKIRLVSLSINRMGNASQILHTYSTTSRWNGIQVLEGDAGE